MKYCRKCPYRVSLQSWVPNQDNVLPLLSLNCLFWTRKKTLNKNLNARFKVLSHVSWAEIKDQRNVPYKLKSYFFSTRWRNVLFTLSWLSWSGQVTGDHNPTDYLSTPPEAERSRGLKTGGVLWPPRPGKSQATDKFPCPVNMKNQPQNIKHEIKGLWNNGFRQPQWWSWW